MKVDELVEFFANTKFPPGTKLNKATTILNPEKYVEVNLDVVKSWPGDLNKCPSYWHLCELVAVLIAESSE